MTSKARVKTYGRAKKIDSNYVSKPVSPFRITDASIAIDALLSKNMKKRKSSDNKNVVRKKTRGRPEKIKTAEHVQTSFAILDNDSWDIKINSTFDNLLQGPVYNQVNIRNKSSLFVNSSTDTSDSKNLSVKMYSNNYNTRTRKVENKRLHSIDNYNNLENNTNNVLSKGKIRKRKNNPRKLKQVIRNVINISDTTISNHNISKKIHSYLDKSVNYSLIIDRQSNQKNILSERSFTCARKFTPIAASKLLSVSNNYKLKQDHNIFHHGFRHLMRAENTPKFIHSSTPIVTTRNIKVDKLKFNVSPITTSIRSRLNFTCNSNNSKSFFESKKISDISLIQNTSINNLNKNNLSDVILINSTNNIEPHNVQNISEVILSDSIDNNSLLLNVKEKTQTIPIDEKRIISKYINKQVKNSLIVNDVKLNGKAIVLLKKHLDILELKSDTSLNINTHKELNPIVRLEKLSLSKYIGNQSNKNASNSEICTIYQNSGKTDYIEEKVNSQITDSSVHKNEYCDFNSIKMRNDIRNSKREYSNVNINSKFSTNLQSSVYYRNLISPESILSSQIRTRSSNYKNRHSSSNGMIESKNVIKLDATVDEEKISKVIKHGNNEISLSVPKNFITTRKKRVQINIEPVTNFEYESKNNTKPLNINSKTWEKFSHCTVNLRRLEKYHDGQKIKRKTHDNIVDNCTNADLNRKSIFLKPGKKWFRSLSILRQTQFHENEDNRCNKGRKWHDSICEVFEKQDNIDGASSKIGKESLVNDMKNKISPCRRTTFGIRKSLKILNISINNSSVLAEETVFGNKSGYVSTLTHVSILESIDKLSLNTNVIDCKETARQIILKRCGQTDPIAFNDCYSARTLKKCRKIGEGVYGEVFMYKSLDNECRVIKVIPIEGNLVVNGEHQKKFEEIISEIIIASELSNLRINNEFCTNGFAELLQICCVQGKYPQHLLDLWDLYDEERGSENDSPEIFTEDQLYIVLELANGGQDLESYRFNNAEQSYTLFVQIVCSLAVAESALQFEHRDMHWGNILISPIDEATINFRLKGREFEVATKGVKVSIIDFTLSRVTYDNYCIYNDLGSDPDLFIATGDYQFDIYRLMKQRNENIWQAFEPYTNILWLDYTLEKMIGHVRYLRENTKAHKTYIRRLSQLRKKILNFNSATELLNSDVFSHVFL